MRTAYALLGLTFLVVFGAAYLIFERAYAPTQPEITALDGTMLTLSSPAFAHDGTIPARYTCEGENVSPELRVSGVPEGAASLALIVTDPDIPSVVKESRGIEVFDHWVLFNIPPETQVIGEGEAPGVAGQNSAGAGYIGPCPPREYEPREHRYVFELYALDAELPLAASAGREEVEAALAGHVLEHAELVGRYEKQTN